MWSRQKATNHKRASTSFGFRPQIVKMNVNSHEQSSFATAELTGGSVYTRQR